METMQCSICQMSVIRSVRDWLGDPAYAEESDVYLHLDSTTIILATMMLQFKQNVGGSKNSCQGSNLCKG